MTSPQHAWTAHEWPSAPLKRHFRVVGGSTPGPDPDNWDGDICWVTPADLSALGALRIRTSKRTITEVGLASCGTTVVPKGSLVLSTRAPIGSLGIADQPLCTNQGCKSLVPMSGTHSRFFAYVLSVSSSMLNAIGRGSTFMELSGDDLGAYAVPTPPLDEQRRIAAFLDYETARIDELVHEQSALLKGIERRWISTLDSVLWRGSPFTDWRLGGGAVFTRESEDGWKRVRLKHVVDHLSVGIVVEPSQYVADEGLPYIYGADIKDGVLGWEKARRIDPEVSRTQPKSLLRAGDVLVVRVGDPGQCAVVPPECEGGNCASVIHMRPSGELMSEWLAYAIRSTRTQAQIDLVTYGAAQRQFNVAHAQEFWLDLPPINVQHEAVSALLASGESMRGLSGAAKRSTELLRERRSALITAAVTGQIDVSSWTPPADWLTPEVA